MKLSNLKKIIKEELQKISGQGRGPMPPTNMGGEKSPDNDDCLCKPDAACGCEKCKAVWINNDTVSCSCCNQAPGGATVDEGNLNERKVSIPINCKCDDGETCTGSKNFNTWTPWNNPTIDCSCCHDGVWGDPTPGGN